METREFIDWLSYVLEDEVIVSDADAKYWFNRLNLGNADVHRVKARNGYARAWQNWAGAIIQCTEQRPDMGVNLLMTGSVLGKYQWNFVLRDVLEFPGHVARLDLTVDAKDYGLDPKWCHSLAIAGAMECPAHNVTLVQSKTGSTCYIGSRSSDRFMRIYDKAGEQGIDGADWKRIELECAGERAQWAAEHIIEQGPTAIAGIILAYVNFPIDVTWNTIFNDVVPAETVSFKKVSDTEKWLLERVAKTLAKTCVQHPEFEQEFQNALLAEIRVLKEGRKLCDNKHD